MEEVNIVPAQMSRPIKNVRQLTRYIDSSATSCRLWTLLNCATIHDHSWPFTTTHYQPWFCCQYPGPPTASHNFTATIQNNQRPAIILLPPPTTTHSLPLFHHRPRQNFLKNELFQSYFPTTLNEGKVTVNAHKRYFQKQLKRNETSKYKKIIADIVGPTRRKIITRTKINICSIWALVQKQQGLGREKDGNRVNLWFLSIVFPFEIGRLWCSILVIKMAVRFKVARSLLEGHDDSRINDVFLKLITEWIKKLLAHMQSITKS